MKSLKIIGLFIILGAIAMLILAFYSLTKDEEALIVFASFFTILFISGVYMAIGFIMIFYKKKDKSEVKE